jgi:hypothetical protein
MSDRRPIKLPEKNHPDDKVRTVIEAAVSVIPGGSGIAKLMGDLAPTQSQKARGKWEQAVSERTNENTDRLDNHDHLLTPKTTLDGGAVQLAVAMAWEPGDGMRGRGRSIDDLCKLLPDVERSVVEQAAFELGSYGLVEIQRFIGKHWLLYLTQRFYEQIDHQVMDWQSTTEDDARVLSRLLLEDEAREWTPTLHTASGWEKRRFNPAFRRLIRLIPEERISGEVQPDYPARSLSLIDEDYVMLRRFAAEN